MKKWVSGLIVGVVLASSTVVGASSDVTVQNTPQVKFKFNGAEKQVPEGYTVLMYQDRTYVPARFVADNMGGSVDWDQANQTVIVNSKQRDLSTALKNARDLSTSALIGDSLIETLQASADIDNSEDSMTINFITLASGESNFTAPDLTSAKNSVDYFSNVNNGVVQHLQDKGFAKPIIDDFKNMGVNIHVMYQILEKERYILQNRHSISDWSGEFVKANSDYMALKIDTKNLVETYQNGNLVDQHKYLESLINQLQ